MSKIDTLNIEINAKLNIPDKTIEQCLWLIKMWLEDNPDKRIRGGVRGADGKIMPFVIERRSDDD